MRYIPLLILCGILLVTALLSLRLPAADFPGLAVVYLLCLLVFHVIALLSLQKDTADSAPYEQMYRWATRVSALVGMALAVQFNRVHQSDNALLLLIAAIVLGIAQHGTTVRHLVHDWGGPLHPATKLLAVEGAVLLSCGALALSSLHANLSVGALAVRASFGGYMLLRGLIDFGFAAGAIRNRAFWLTLNGWLPAVPGLLCFTLLCVFIVRHQMETARQHASDEQISELVWEEIQ